MTAQPNKCDATNLDSTYFITTEDAVGKIWLRKYLWILILCGAFFLAMAIGSLFMQFDGPDLPFLRYFASFNFAIYAIYCFRPFPRGTWRIDNTGVEQTSLHGKTTRTMWSEIEAVKWSRYYTALRSSAGKIVLPLPFIEQSERDAVLGFIESHLDEFDLRHRRKRIKRTWKRWATVASIAAVSVGIWFIGINIPAIQIQLSFIKDPEKFLRIMWYAVSVFTCMFLMQLIDGRLPKWRRRGVRYPGLEK